MCRTPVHLNKIPSPILHLLLAVLLPLYSSSFASAQLLHSSAIDDNTAPSCTNVRPLLLPRHRVTITAPGPRTAGLLLHPPPAQLRCEVQPRCGALPASAVFIATPRTRHRRRRAQPSVRRWQLLGANICIHAPLRDTGRTSSSFHTGKLDFVDGDSQFRYMPCGAAGRARDHCHAARADLISRAITRLKRHLC
jgi:hypothetical protein